MALTQLLQTPIAGKGQSQLSAALAAISRGAMALVGGCRGLRCDRRGSWDGNLGTRGGAVVLRGIDGEISQVRVSASVDTATDSPKALQWARWRRLDFLSARGQRRGEKKRVEAETREQEKRRNIMGSISVCDFRCQRCWGRWGRMTKRSSPQWLMGFA
ncbi:hypothetical protein CCMA1212_010084 [Trichoderma ghanense]|uniref:Uncharacterized protein n=1 Tax=Trichoderma ghanense TaxID=65468 RepID=A0ABY2GSB5_9HYPO